MSKKMINFDFSGESSQLEIEDSLELTNSGNIPVSYKWMMPDKCPFRIEPSEGVIQKFGAQVARVKYKPTNPKDTMHIKLDVVSGISKILTCSGHTKEVKVELSQHQINFNYIPVCQRVQETFFIMNKHKKNSAYYKIEKDKFAEGFDIKPLCGRIGPEDKQKFEISFYSSVVTDIKQKRIMIDIRGNKQLSLFVSVVTQVPRIEILESIFDFGQITYGNKGQLQMTLTNTCSIEALIELDLSSSNENMQEKLDCLDIQEEGDKGQKNSTVKVLQKVMDNSITNNSTRSANRKYLMTIHPFKTYIFKLTFIPMKPKIYK
jgi:hypothetical protein